MAMMIPTTFLTIGALLLLAANASATTVSQTVPPEIERYTLQKEKKCFADNPAEFPDTRQGKWISFIDLKQYGKAAIVNLVMTKCANSALVRGSAGFNIAVFKILGSSSQLLFDNKSAEYKISTDRTRLYLNLHGAFCNLTGAEPCIGVIDFQKETLRYHKLNENACKEKWSDLCQFYLVDKDLWNWGE